jgi:predicted amidohydrolase
MRRSLGRGSDRPGSAAAGAGRWQAGHVRIAVVQPAFDYSRPVDERREQAAALVRAQAGADLVVLTELWPQSAFDSSLWEPLAEPLHGPSLAAISAAARDIGAVVHAGSFVERADDGRLFNTSAVVDADGSLLATYRKIHLFGFDEGEARHVSAGEDVVVVPTAVGRVGLATCYDLRFPELFRRLVDADAELVVMPAGWPAARITHWSVLAQARAIESQLVVVAANASGTQAGIVMGGHSAVIDALGEVVAEGGAGEEVLTAEVDLAHVARWRAQFPALADRRL